MSSLATNGDATRQMLAMLFFSSRAPGVMTDPERQGFLTALADWYLVARLVCQAIPGEPRPREWCRVCYMSIVTRFQNH